MKRILIILLAALLLPAMAGCRTRTTGIVPETTETGVAETSLCTQPQIEETLPNPPSREEEEEEEEPADIVSEETTLPEESLPETEPEPILPPETEAETVPETTAVTEAETEDIPPQEAEPDPNALTKEDPDAQRKEYDPGASVDVVPGADNSLLTEDDGQDEQAGIASAPDAEQIGGRENEQAEKTATEIVPAEEAEQIGVADDAETAETALFFYQTLLYDRLSSLFECQRLFIYWETPEAYRTVFKTSAEHQLILDAGAYDVSAKLLEENLTVDDGWVQRKNPGAVVKAVSSQILGYGISDTSAAQNVYADIISRPGWNGIDAVISGRVILLSEDMLESQAMRTAAAVYIAKALYPAEFADINPLEALTLLTEEADGYAASGTFVYIG